MLTSYAIGAGRSSDLADSATSKVHVIAAAAAVHTNDCSRESRKDHRQQDVYGVHGRTVCLSPYLALYNCQKSKIDDG